MAAEMADPIEPPIEVYRASREITMAISWCGTDPCEATWDATTEKAPYMKGQLIIREAWVMEKKRSRRAYTDGDHDTTHDQCSVGRCSIVRGGIECDTHTTESSVRMSGGNPNMGISKSNIHAANTQTSKLPVLVAMGDAKGNPRDHTENAKTNGFPAACMLRSSS